MIHNRRVAAVICLHMGKDYLPYAIRSVMDEVDEIFVMYSPVPNHGTFHSPIPCPESRSDLIEAAYSIVPEKTRWFDYDHWRSEGEQFQAAWPHTTADVIVKLDADEIWAPGLLADAIAHGIEQKAREIRVPLRHYWRSFYKAFTDDPAAPGRIYLREFNTGETTFATSDTRYRIQHFGYAMTLDITRYKMGIHGHKPEFPNPNWFDEVFAPNRQTDCHPIGSDYWQVPSDVVPPDFLMDHPFAKLTLIE